jgi:hypothetical protein
MTETDDWMPLRAVEDDNANCCCGHYDGIADNHTPERCVRFGLMGDAIGKHHLYVAIQKVEYLPGDDQLREHEDENEPDPEDLIYTQTCECGVDMLDSTMYVRIIHANRGQEFDPREFELWDIVDQDAGEGRLAFVRELLEKVPRVD